MTDLHTHILPGMDDGARNADESLAMLRMEQTQGVEAVVLTPHFYGVRETTKAFLARRDAAMQALETRLVQLPERERADLPERILGAEVAWHPALADCEELPQLCIGQTKNLLLELPFTPWSTQMFNQIYDLIGQTGVVPVIAHLERYMKLQSAARISEVFELGVPVQITGETLRHVLMRGKMMRLFSRKRAHILASDCHDCAQRAPSLEFAMQVVRRKLGDECADELIHFSNELAGLYG